MSLIYLRQALQFNRLAGTHIQAMTSWDPEPFALHLRHACFNTIFTNHVAHLDYEPVNLLTAQVHDRHRDPGLAIALDAATHAGKAGHLLFPRQSTDPDSLFSLARQTFAKKVVERAYASFPNVVPSHVDDFKYQAIKIYQHLSLSPMDTPWAALLSEDIRWCLACPETSWAALKQQYPDTAPWLDALSLHCQLYPPEEALLRVWLNHAVPHPCVDQWPLPELDAP